MSSKSPLIPPLNPYSPQEIASFDKIDLALRSHPELAREGATLLNPKALARLVQGIKFFQDVHLGCHPTSKYAVTKKWPVVKLPDEFFRMRESDGPLFHLFVSAYMYKKEASWRQFDFQSKNRFNDNITLLKRIQNDLVASGHLKRPVVYFDESVPQDQMAEYKAIVKKFGGRVVKNFCANGEEDAPTHIVAWDSEEHDSAETLDNEKAMEGNVVEKLYLRTLAVVDPTKTKKIGGIIETTMQDSKKKGGKIKHAKGAAPIEFKDPMAFVHWWYHPSSYDEWMPAADVAGPDTEEPPRPPGGPWIVACKFVRDVAIFNEWGWEGDYALSDYQNKAKCYPALEKKMAEEAKAREAPKPSTLKIRLSLSSSAKNEKAKIDKENEDEEMEEVVKDWGEVRPDVKSTSPKPILQQESKVAPQRLGMEPKQILTGFYTAGGNKKQKMTVHNGALQPPSDAIDLVRDAIKEVQSNAFDDTDENIKLPVIDSFVRPSLDTNIASNFFVTELKPSATGSTEKKEYYQNKIPDNESGKSDDDGDVKMVDGGEGNLPTEDSSKPSVLASSTSTTDKQSGETRNEAHLSKASSSTTAIEPSVEKMKENDKLMTLNQATPHDSKASGIQESDATKADVTSEDTNALKAKIANANSSADDTNDNLSNLTVDMQAPGSSILNSNSADYTAHIPQGETATSENKEVLVTLPEQVSDATQFGAAILVSNSVDNSYNASKALENSGTQRYNQLEQINVTVATDNAHNANQSLQVTDNGKTADAKESVSLPTKVCNSAEVELATAIAMKDATDSSQGPETMKSETKNVPASLSTETSTVTEAAGTLISNSMDEKANISRSPNLSKDEKVTAVNDSSIDDPRNIFQNPDTVRDQSIHKTTSLPPQESPHTTQLAGKLEDKHVKIATEVASSDKTNVATPTPSATASSVEATNVPFAPPSTLSTHALNNSAIKDQVAESKLNPDSISVNVTVSTAPSKLLTSMDCDDDIPELQMIEPDAVPDGAYSRTLPENPSFDKIKKTVPLYGEQEPTTMLPSWYKKTTASDVEKTLLPEWFNNSANHRTESSYVETREKIIDEARQSSSKYLTWTAVRRCVAGDAGSIMRLHEFLVTWGFINGSAIGDNAPLQVTDETLDSANTVWNPEMKNLLCIAVYRWSRKRKLDSESTERLEIDWDAVSKEVGNGATPVECYKIFLSTDFSHLGEGDSVKLPNISNSQKDMTQETFISELIDGVQPSVAKAVINAALDASDGDVKVAQNASIVGAIACKVAQRAREEESATVHILEEILDLRMAKLENRLSLLDDLEVMLDAERMALELERRDLYTRRCRHWFNADSSL